MRKHGQKWVSKCHPLNSNAYTIDIWTLTGVFYSPRTGFTARGAEFAPCAALQVKSIYIVEVLAVPQVVMEAPKHHKPFPEKM